jgi:hypothetical protein
MSKSLHATVHLYDSTLMHVGGVHVPENTEEAMTFKGEMGKLSYHSKKKVAENFHFCINISCSMHST